MPVEQAMELDRQQAEAMDDHLTHCTDDACCGTPPDTLFE